MIQTTEEPVQVTDISDISSQVFDLEVSTRSEEITTTPMTKSPFHRLVMTTEHSYQSANTLVLATVLPIVGVLLGHGRQRFLAISNRLLVMSVYIVETGYKIGLV